MEEPKKISFGFKLTKKAEKPTNSEKRDYIDCVEEKAIKVIGGESIEAKPDLVIPMKPNTLQTSAERLKQIAEQVESSLELDSNQKSTESDTVLTKSIEKETLDQMVVRELLEDAKKEKKIDTMDLVLPVTSHVVVEGQKEASLEDYESVPINQFGMAMLRGMGWAPGKESVKHKAPELRPKGLGLGADKVIKQNKNKIATNDKDSELMLIKNAFVKIVMGKYNGLYGKVVSLDDDTGRVTVELTVKKEIVSINECMVQPVTKTEHEQFSRVINAEKYDVYKNNEKSQNLNASVPKIEKGWDRQSSSKNEQHRDVKLVRNREEYNDYHEDRNYSSTRKNADKGNGVRKDSSKNEEKYEKRKERKYSDNDSLSSDSDACKRKRESKQRHSSVDSRSSDSYEEKRYKKKKSKKTSVHYEKRDIDKKRKGKKKKRDRDRSPNYRKYKK